MKTFELTEEDYLYNTEAHVGLCRACGAERDCCEPDARDYPCDVCSEPAVYGTEELLMMGAIDIVD